MKRKTGHAVISQVQLKKSEKFSIYVLDLSGGFNISNL
jgi:hypothetical protein